jgi:flagellar hook protein FlgE
MALSSALFTGLSGLDVNQTWMQVVGNNIANVNTTAFKSTRALFKPQFYVTDSAGSPPDGDFGGSNPSQLGLGATVGALQKDFSQGSITPTGKSTDMAIDGDGFFITQDASQGQEFTRDGSFNLNGNHQLVTSSGAVVQGYGVDNTGAVVPGQLQGITIPLGAATIAKATQNVTLVGNLAADGTPASGGSILDSQDLTISAGAGGGTPVGTTLLSQLANASNGTSAFTVGQAITLNAQRDGSNLTPATFNVTATSTVTDLQNFFNNSLGIDTSAAGTGSALIAGTAANSVDLQITGNSGAANALAVPAVGFSDASGNVPLTFQSNPNGVPAGESTSTTLTVYDSLGVPVSVNVTTALQSTNNGGTTWKFYATSSDNIDANNPGATLVGTGTLQFDNNGVLQSVTGGTLNINRAGTGAQPILPITLDFSGMSALAQDTAHQGSTMEMSSQDGIQLGTLSGFSVGADGSIIGSYDNGQTRTLGQLALATFNNPQGLNDQGGNSFTTGADSGVAIITAPETLGSGAIRSESLEGSNVDLSAEFTNLIQASTGFSASSRVISTSDQLITDLLNSAH